MFLLLNYLGLLIPILIISLGRYGCNFIITSTSEKVPRYMKITNTSWYMNDNWLLLLLIYMIQFRFTFCYL